MHTSLHARWYSCFIHQGMVRVIPVSLGLEGTPVSSRERRYLSFIQGGGDYPCSIQGGRGLSVSFKGKGYPFHPRVGVNWSIQWGKGTPVSSSRWVGVPMVALQYVHQLNNQRSLKAPLRSCQSIYRTEGPVNLHFLWILMLFKISRQNERCGCLLYFAEHSCLVSPRNGKEIMVGAMFHFKTHLFHSSTWGGGASPKKDTEFHNNDAQMEYLVNWLTWHRSTHSSASLRFPEWFMWYRSVGTSSL